MSWDLFLGAPYNIASYAILTHMVAQVCGLEVGELVGYGVDSHIYLNHFDQVREQLSRESYPMPQLWLNPEVKDINDFTFDDVKVINYQAHPSIKAPVAV